MNTNRNTSSTAEQENNLDIRVVRDEFRYVIQQGYMKFLTLICNRIHTNATNDVERERRKFNAVRKELLDYLFQHRDFIRLKRIRLYLLHHKTYTSYLFIEVILSFN